MSRQIETFGQSAVWLALLCGTLTFAAPARAQEESSQADNQNDSGNVIVVTGTHIRGVAPVGSDLKVIGNEELGSFPSQSVVETLNRLPEFSGSGYNSAVPVAAGPGARAGNSSRGSDINLRGIGPRGTLVLFDGARRPPTGSSGYASDVSTMPTMTIERVEILADGGSAVYGSDAVAGVVNFIPMRSFDGLRVRARAGIADGFDNQVLGLVGGTEWDRGGLVLSGEISWQSNLSGVDRDYFRSDLREQGGQDFRSIDCAPGNILVDGTSYAIPAGGVTPATSHELVAGTANRCEIGREGDLLPEQRITTLYAAAEHDFDFAKINIRGVWSEREWRTLETDQGSQSNHLVVNVPSSNAYFVRPPGTSGPVSVAYNFGADYGPLVTDGYVRYRNVGAGADFDLFGDWTASINYDYSKVDDTWAVLGVYTPALNAALASSDPDTAYNVFGRGGANAGAKAESLFRNYFDPTAFYTLHEARGGLSGSLFSLPGGEVRTAAGVEWYRLKTVTGNRIGDVLTLDDRPFNVRDTLIREVTSVYGEIYLPIFGSGNAVPGFESLEFSAALRTDDYSDFGSTTNPKLGVNWTPISGLKIRGSYGTSFIAPYLGATISPSIGGALRFQSLTDPLSPTGTSIGAVWSDGNPDLGPETATTWSLGLEWTPDELPGLLLKVTNYWIDYRGQVGTVNTATALQDLASADFVTRNPTPDQLAAIAATGVRVIGSAPSPAFLIDARNFNLGGSKLSGLDVLLSYEWGSAASNWIAEISTTYNYKYDFSALPGGHYVDRLNDVFYPRAFRSRGHLGWSRDSLFLDGYVNFMGKSHNTLVSPVQSVGSYLTVDLRAGVELSQWIGTGRDLTLSVEALNLLDEDPPFVDLDGGVDFTAATPVGRELSITLGMTF